MADGSSLDADIGALRTMISGPDTGLTAFLADRSYLHSPDEARDDLARLIIALEGVAAGRVVPQAQIRDDLAARCHRHGTQAAE